MAAPRSTLTNGMDYIDLRFLDHPQIIATAVLTSTAGVALIDPGVGPLTTMIFVLPGASSPRGRDYPTGRYSQHW